jgi:hypothetical protein
MEQDRSNNEIPQGLTDEHKKQFESLQSALEKAEKRGRTFEEDWSNLFDQNKALREENHRLQHGYEELRIQKGGFGFKMLMLSGMGGFITALVLCFVYLKLRPKPAQAQALQQFRREKLFEYELALSKRQHHEVMLSLEKNMKHPDFQPIRTELEIMRGLVSASEKGCR